MNFKKLKCWLKLVGVVAVSTLLAACDTMPQQNQAPPPPETSPPQISQTTNQAPPPSNTPPSQVSQTTNQASRASQYLPVIFYLAQQERAAGLISLKSEKGEIWVGTQPMMTRADLAMVQPRTNANGQPFVRFTFSNQGARKLEDITTRYRGKIMVITVGENVIDLLLLDTVVKDGTLDVLTRTEQEAVVIANTVAKPLATTKKAKQ